MKAMIFAAGRGERMGELTRSCPKPLLEVGGKALIEHAIERLRDAGISELVINLAYLGDQIRDCLGDGRRLQVSIRYSEEGEALETGGGILKALPLLGTEPFLIVNADVWSDYPLQRLRDHVLAPEDLGHLVMVPNPDHLPAGNFYLNEAGRLQSEQGGGAVGSRLTYSGLALLRPELIAEYPHRRKRFALGEVLRAAIADGRLSAELYAGEWRDIGTPERLQELRRDRQR